MLLDEPEYRTSPLRSVEASLTPMLRFGNARRRGGKRADEVGLSDARGENRGTPSQSFPAERFGWVVGLLVSILDAWSCGSHGGRAELAPAPSPWPEVRTRVRRLSRR